MGSHFGLIQFRYLDGALGVALFFMVSGYCISMTSLKKKNFFSFWKARYLRLLPLFFLSLSFALSFSMESSPARRENVKKGVRRDQVRSNQEREKKGWE